MVVNFIFSEYIYIIVSFLYLRYLYCAYFDSYFVMYFDFIQEEQFKLKQELAELAISLNMEAQKGRQQEADFQK